MSIEDIFETLVAEFFTRDPYVFIHEQYSIKDSAAGEWSCPDFVALNFRDHVVSVVEVNTAYKPEGLLEKVGNCDRQWLDLLRAQLAKRSIADGWNYRVEVFVRRAAVEAVKAKAGNRPDVLVHTLEELKHPWEWDWPAAD